jgi:putative intracellular protease/amidase
MPARTRPRARPIHLLAGSPGARRNVYGPLLAELLTATGKPLPTVGYLGAATDDDPRFLGWMEALLAAGGPCRMRLAPVKGPKVAGGAARAVLEAADLIFVGGGDVELGMRRVEERDLAGTLRAGHAAGVPVFGISAGAIMLSREWIRWPDPDDDGSAERFPCLGLAPVRIDCHGEEDGWAELQALLRLAGGRAVAHGLRAGAAVRVAGEDAVEVVLGTIDRFQVKGGDVVPVA